MHMEDSVDVAINSYMAHKRMLLERITKNGDVKISELKSMDPDDFLSQNLHDDVANLDTPLSCADIFRVASEQQDPMQQAVHEEIPPANSDDAKAVTLRMKPPTNHDAIPRLSKDALYLGLIMRYAPVYVDSSLPYPARADASTTLPVGTEYSIASIPPRPDDTTTYNLVSRIVKKKHRGIWFDSDGTLKIKSKYNTYYLKLFIDESLENLTPSIISNTLGLTLKKPNVPNTDTNAVFGIGKDSVHKINVKLAPSGHLELWLKKYDGDVWKLIVGNCIGENGRKGRTTHDISGPPPSVGHIEFGGSGWSKNMYIHKLAAHNW